MAYDSVAALAGFQHTDIALTINRVVLGTFFAISGANKLFHRGRHESLKKTLQRLKVPAVRFNEWWVPGWEFVAGIMLIVGLFSGFAAGVLAIICCVACLAEGPQRIAKYAPINKADFVADVLYLQEVLYIVGLTVVVLAGPGQYSLDWVWLHRG